MVPGQLVSQKYNPTSQTIHRYIVCTIVSMSTYIRRHIPPVSSSDNCGSGKGGRLSVKRGELGFSLKMALSKFLSATLQSRYDIVPAMSVRTRNVWIFIQERKYENDAEVKTSTKKDSKNVRRRLKFNDTLGVTIGIHV